MSEQNIDYSNSKTPTIPATRPPRATIRPTRASLAREAMIQAKQQQRRNSTVRTSLPQDMKKVPLPSPSSSTATESKKPRSRTSLSTATGKTSARPIYSPKNPDINKTRQTKSTATTTATKRKSLITTKESLKKRPAWDMRGQFSDVQAEVKNARDRLDELYKFKDEWEILKQDKESDRKKAIQRVVEIKAEMQKVKMDHEQEMKNLDEHHRIHHQELLDKQLIYKQQEATMEIELDDAKRKLKEAQTTLDHALQQKQQLEGNLSQLMTDVKARQEESHRVELKLQRYDGTLADREQEILRLKKVLDKKLPVLDVAEIKLQESQAANERLQLKIDQLEMA